MTELQKELKKVSDSLPNKEYNQKKYELFEFMIYCEWDNCNKLLDNCIKYAEDKKGLYAIMLHDKDFYQEMTFDDTGRLLGAPGELKKEHYHCVIKLPYAVTLSDICLYVGIKQKWCFHYKPKQLEDRIIYITHKLEVNKTKYDINLIDTNRRDYCEYIYANCNDNNERDPIRLALDYIEINKKVSYKGFVKYLIDNNVSSTNIKQYWVICKDLIYERIIDNRNREIEKQEDEDRLKTIFGDFKVEEFDRISNKKLIKVYKDGQFIDLKYEPINLDFFTPYDREEIIKKIESEKEKKNESICRKD